MCQLTSTLPLRTIYAIVQSDYEPLRIGSIRIDPPVALAPMAGVTNHAFRVICRRLGAGLVYTDMISSYALHYRNVKTLRMFDWTPEERPVAVQIFGAEPDKMAAGARMIADAGADIIDINIGCPVPKVTKEAKVKYKSKCKAPLKWNAVEAKCEKKVAKAKTKVKAAKKAA